jgi:ribosomal-protein-alanine N-acetyltransferase
MARLATLRLATAQDVPQIAEMARDLIEQGLGWSWTRTRVARNLRHTESSTVVACCGSQVVGFAIMYFGADHAHLNLLAVRPVWQRRGLGRRMLGWMEESARVAGISAIHLEVRASNAAGRRFYRALGFQEMALLPRYYSGREAAIWMARDLRTRAASQSGLIPPPTA